MKNTTFKMRVSEEWLERVKGAADKDRKSVAEFIREAVDAVLDEDDYVLEPYLPKSLPKELVEPQSDDPRKSVAVALAAKPNVIKAKEQAEAAVSGWKPDPRLSKEHATRGKGKKKGGKK